MKVFNWTLLYERLREYTHCNAKVTLRYLNRYRQCTRRILAESFILYTLDPSRSLERISMTHDESAKPSSAGLQPFPYQVGGHKQMQIIGEGALIVKAALPLELQFYQNIQANPALTSLRPWVPTYLGTLRLEGQTTAEGIASVEGIPETVKDEYSYRYFASLKNFES